MVLAMKRAGNEKKDKSSTSNQINEEWDWGVQRVVSVPVEVFGGL